MIEGIAASISGLSETAMVAAREWQGTLTKPPGSLGRLEELAVWLAGVSGKAMPAPLRRRAVVVLAADHGVTAQGISAYPAEVTAQMVRNFAAGGAAINSLAAVAQARVVVADLGVAGDLSDVPGLRRYSVAPGTADMSQEPAMTHAQAEQALAAGIAIIQDEIANGLDVICIGEMGIGNTTAAAAITAAITDTAPEIVTGRGTGLDDERLAHKTLVVAKALAVNRPNSRDGLDVLAKVGGFELGGMVSIILGAAAQRIPIVLDGYITGAAALVATLLCPTARDYLVAAHRSQEPGHAVALSHLGLSPLLDLELRLGEGSGAVLALPLLDAALAMHAGMATFDSARVSGRAV